MKLLIAITLFLFATFANAYTDLITQPNSVRQTFSVQIADISPAATATDVLTITGQTGKVIRINRIEVAGDATNIGVIDFYFYKRFAANTGGTSTAQLAVENDSQWPIDNIITNTGFVVGQTYIISATSTACSTIGAANNTISTVFVATATSASTCIATESTYAKINLYSANPSALGYGQLIRATHYPLAAAAATGYPGSPWIEDFGVRNDQELVLRGPSESLSFSLNGQTLPVGLSVYVLITWAEE